MQTPQQPLQLTVFLLSEALELHGVPQMNQVLFFIFVLSFSTQANADALESKLSLDWNYNYSSNVIHAKLIKNQVSVTNDGKCKVNYSTFEVIESFKGNIKKGTKFSSTGIGAHEVNAESSEQLLLLKPFVATEYPGYGECSNEEYSNFLSIHNWCCSIDNTNEHSLIMYDMLNSEQKSENYLYPSREVFNYLRQLKK
ncbi:MAG: hypothetical protein ACJAZB_002105 [Psychrosphaera sp.]